MIVNVSCCSPWLVDESRDETPFSIEWQCVVRPPNRVRIDLSSLVHNLNEVRRLVRPGTKVMGVVKSDAYGHGLIPVSSVLEGSGIDCLGVAHLTEALELRKNGIRSPIMILCGIRTREDAAEAVEKDLTPVLYDMEACELLASECLRRGRKLRVHVKVDTGMGRLGVPCADVGPFLRNLMESSTLFVEGLTSHLSSVDEDASEFTLLQIERFKRAVATGRVMGLELPLNNLANSGGVMRYRDSHFDLVRPGIMLYGGLPSPEFPHSVPLRPVMALRGRILQVREFSADTPVSYGRAHVTKGPTRVAVLSAGYGDGLPRSLSDAGKVLIGGERCDILGRVCMNMVVADVTAAGTPVPGDEVVFLGTQGKEKITGDDMARWGGTISYEIFCSIGRRHTREYLT
ncbi:MAG: alanine racemase [Deltaproteobacteria bacterium]|nr:alanine racemase [Deltaproteobacteria bacterium]